DEVRIWNVAHTQWEIQSTINSELTGGNSLIGRWGMNEGTGTTIASSIGTPTGTLTNGPVWVPGAPLNINLAPNLPAVNNPSNGATGVPTLTPLTVTVADPESNPMTVQFYGRLKTNSPRFSLVLLPDTQYYTMVGNQPTGATIFNGQTNWIVNNKTARNIAFVNNLGDMTEQNDAASYDGEWTIADAAFDILDAGNVPYNVLPGNHDLITGATRFETWFGVSRFGGKSYYGGHYGTDNTNNYNLFSASGLDFILINLSCPAAAPPAAVLDWANTLLAANSNRRGIAVCHDLLAAGTPAAFSASGQAVYTALKGNPNLFLLLGGHVYQAGSRTDTFNGNTVYSMRSDYQYEPNGGNGWLRILEFQPANDRIQVWTYSPYLSQSLTDATNQFAVAYDMSGPWQLIGTVNSVASGSTASVNWTGLGYATQYEWYATANDGLNTTTSPTWSFITEDVPTAVTLSSFTVLAIGSANNWLTPFGLVLGILATTIGGMGLIRNR
ncbi:MAG: phosphohydrolase, partial [Acidobacteriota bacterium]